MRTRTEQVHWDKGTQLLVKLEDSFPVIDSKKSGEYVSLSGRTFYRVWIVTLQEFSYGWIPGHKGRLTWPSPHQALMPSLSPRCCGSHPAPQAFFQLLCSPSPTPAGNSRLHPPTTHNEAVANSETLRNCVVWSAASHLCYYLSRSIWVLPI